jgi:hypothetical protein
VLQQQNPKPIENITVAPPVKSNNQATISQPRPPPQNTKKARTVPKGEQIIQQKVPIENINPEHNTNELKKRGQNGNATKRKITMSPT